MSKTPKVAASGNSRKAIAVYTRVSTSKQDLAAQVPDLKTWLRTHAKGRPVRWYKDTFTGATMRRPGMGTLEADVVAGKVGVLVVWRLDRLGRTVLELLDFFGRLDVAGVQFVSVRDAIDPVTAAGRLMRTILAAFAEYEREVISERIRAGIKRARAEGREWRGRKEGTRTKLTPKVLRSIHTLLQAGTKKAEIARQLGIDRSTVYEALRIRS